MKFHLKKYQAAWPAVKNNEEMIFKLCTQFANFISKIRNAKVNNINNLDEVMKMYNALKHSYSDITAIYLQEYL